jgi:hypothetical protein
MELPIEYAYYGSQIARGERCGSCFRQDKINLKCADLYHKTPGHKPKPETTCIDCGQPTTPGKGSARCPSCWEDRCDYLAEFWEPEQ